MQVPVVSGVGQPLLPAHAVQGYQAQYAPQVAHPIYPPSPTPQATFSCLRSPPPRLPPDCTLSFVEAWAALIGSFAIPPAVGGMAGHVCLSCTHSG